METKELIKHLEDLTNLRFQEVESSNIYLVAFHEYTRRIYIIFKAKKGELPKWIYVYRSNILCWRAFLQAESKGKFFQENIKPFVKYKSEIPY